MEIKVYYEDTDCGGVVYYANYLRYFERARTERFERRGIDLAAYQDKGVVFAVVHAEIDYKFPARYGDLLEVETAVEGVKGSSFTVQYTIRRKKDGAVLVTGQTRMACVNGGMKPIRLPDDVRAALLTQ